MVHQIDQVVSLLVLFGQVLLQAEEACPCMLVFLLLNFADSLLSRSQVVLKTLMPSLVKLPVVLLCEGLRFISLLVFGLESICALLSFRLLQLVVSLHVCLVLLLFQNVLCSLLHSILHLLIPCILDSFVPRVLLVHHLLRLLQCQVPIKHATSHHD